uniref:Exonuclease 1 n=1 Tax=Strongyloides venezuelensis TaxID=75913 RepID=A0A0K0F7B9_STRVS
MGIPDLLKFVEKARKKDVNIIAFKGRTLAIDASCFIYKGLYSQSLDDLLGKKSRKCVDYLLKTVNIIVKADIHAIFVFDGRVLPSKKLTNDKRDATREENKKEAEALLKMGNQDEALRKFRRSYSISKEVRDECIQALREFANVDVIVAPYEADAELTFLVNSNLAHAAVTIDSDLLAFGCERVIYNLNVDNALCEYIEFQNIRDCFSSRLQSTFNSDLLRYMCIFRGCDYFKGLKGMAFKTAEKFFSRISNRDPVVFIKFVKTTTKLNVGDINEFTDGFVRANNTFLYQIVYDPRDGQQKPLNSYSSELLQRNEGHDNSVSSLESGNCLWYAGQVLPPNISRLLAIGNDYEEILENNLRFTTPHSNSHRSIWREVITTHFNVNSINENSTTSPHSLQVTLSRKRKSLSDDNWVAPFKRHVGHNLQLINQVDKTRKSNDSGFDKATCPIKNEISRTQSPSKRVENDVLDVPKKVNPIIGCGSVNLVATESKYFKKTSEGTGSKLCTNNVTSVFSCKRVFF